MADTYRLWILTSGKHESLVTKTAYGSWTLSEIEPHLHWAPVTLPGGTQSQNHFLVFALLSHV